MLDEVLDLFYPSQTVSEDRNEDRNNVSGAGNEPGFQSVSFGGRCNWWRSIGLNRHMALDAKAPSIMEAEKSDTPSWISPWISALSKPMWLFVLFAAACPVLWAFFFYFEGDVWSWFLDLGLFCLLPLGCFLLWTLFRRRWRAVALFTTAIAWTLFTYPILGPDEPLRWLRIVGFRVHVFPMERYVANCRLQEFVDDGKPQKLGPCQGVEVNQGLSLNRVFYDSSRQLDLPQSGRTEAWKQAMVRATDQDVVEGWPVRTVHLVGKFLRDRRFFLMSGDRDLGISFARVRTLENMS